MATQAGTIKSLENGIFFVKDENGNITQLKVGDIIFENDTVYGYSSNAPTSKLEIELAGNDVIVLSQGEKQLIDASLIETAFGTEELYFTREGLDLDLEGYQASEDVVSDLRDAQFTEETQGENEEDITEEETAEGEEAAEDETTGVGQFQARDGDATNIASDLRDATFQARTQSFVDRNMFRNESEDRLSFDINDNPSNPFNPTIPTVPTIPNGPISTPSDLPNQSTDLDDTTPSSNIAPVIIADLSVDDITAYETEGFLEFTVSLDKIVYSDVTFTYTTSALTATENKDYEQLSGTITIPQGSASINIKIPIYDDYLSDNGETMKIIISNVEGNAQVVKPEGIGTILDDTQGTVTATLSATADKEGGNITYTVTLTNLNGKEVNPQNDVTVKLKNGETITINNTQTKNSITIAAQSDDVYIDAADVTNSIDTISGGNFEKLVINKANVTVNVADTIDTTKVTVTTQDVDENQENVTFNFQTTNPPQAGTTATLTVDVDGTTHTVNLDATGKGLLSIASKDEDVYKDEQTITATVKSINGGNFEATDVSGATASAKVVDTVDNTILTLEDITVNEADNATATINASLSNDTKVELVVTLDNGATITFPAGTTAGTKVASTPFAINNDEDVYSDNSSFTVKVSSTDNDPTVDNNFENLITTDTATVTVNDTTTPVTVNLTASSVTEDEADTSYIFTATLSEKSQGDTTVTTNQGTIIILDGQTTGTLKIASNNISDYLKDSSELTAKISAVTGGNFEKINIGTDTATAKVLDTQTPIYVKITNDSEAFEGENLSHTVSLVDENGNAVVVPAGETITVNLSYSSTNDVVKDGDFSNIRDTTVTISSGESTKTITNSTIVDKLVENSEKYTLTINSVSQANDTFEKVDIDATNQSVTGTIKDNEVKIVLVATNASGDTPLDSDGKVDFTKNINSTNEGGKLYYKAIAIDSNGFELDVQSGTVDLAYATTADNSDLDATAGTDFDNTKTTVDIGKVFEVDATNDYLKEGDEKFEVTISNPKDTSYDKVSINSTNNKVTSTIQDQTTTFTEEDTVYAIITGAKSVNEGDTTTNYTVKLVDKDGNEVKVTQETDVTVTYTNVTTQDGDTQHNNNETITVTIPANGSSNTFKVDIKDDYIADNNEKFNLKITNVDTNEFENVVIGDKSGNNKDVTTTILDDSMPNTPNNPNDSVETDMHSVTVKLVSTDSSGNITSAATIAEGEIAYYKAILVDPNENQITNATGSVDITFTDATAIRTGTDTNGELDFTGTDATVALNTVFLATAKDDYIADSGEKFNVQITDDTYTNASFYENVIHDTTAVVTTIIDNSKNTPETPYDEKDSSTPPVENDLDTITIKLFAIDAIDGSRKAANEVAEGNSAEYIAVAFDKDGNEVLQGETVEVTFGKTNDSAIKDVDYDGTTQTVTLGTKFSTATKDDYIADNGETYKVQIKDETLSNAKDYETVEIDTTSVTTTITDGVKDAVSNEPIDTVYVQLFQDASVYEASTATLTHKIKLVDKDGNSVNLANGETIELELKYENDTTSSADFSEKKTTITITGNGSSEYSFSNKVLDDNLNEGTESYDVKIDSITSHSNYFENVAIADTTNGANTTVNSAKGTIIETIDLENEDTSVVEGGVVISNTTESLNLLSNDETGTNGKIVSFDYKDEAGTIQTAILTGTAGSKSATVDSQYGNITINENGTWQFTSDVTENNPTGLDDIFTYTVEDDNGKTNTASFTIKVTDTAPTVSTVTKVSVDEDDLPTIGTSPDNSALTVESSLKITAGKDTFDTIFTVNEGDSGLTSKGSKIYYYLSDDDKTLIASTSNDETSINASNTIFTDTLSDTTNENAKHTFVLSGVIDHADANAQNNTELSFSYKVTDSDGDIATGSFKVDIVDDVPKAVADTNSITEDSASVSDNLFTNDELGADTTTLTGVKTGNDTSTDATTNVNTDVTGTYGKVKIASDGTYTYTLDNTNPAVQALNNDETLTDTFVYTIKDADGDTSTTTLTITINGNNNDVPTLSINNDTVNESGLAEGSSPDNSKIEVSNTFTIGAIDGLKEIVVDGTIISKTDLLNSGTSNITINNTSDKGNKLVINGYDETTGVVNYTYTLLDNEDHSAGDVTDTISITVKDTDTSGTTNSVTKNLIITIVDDTPTAVVDNSSVEEGASKINGNVITNDTKGVDDATVHQFTYTKTDGSSEMLTFNSSNITYTKNTPTGKLTVNQDGSWEFTPIVSVDHDDDDNTLGSFTYTLIDGDGDISNSVKNTITVTDTIATVTPVDTVTLDEDDLATGSDTDKESLVSADTTLGITTGKDDITDVVFDLAKIQADSNMTSLKSNGQALTFSLSDSNHELTAKDHNGNEVFVVTINNNGTAGQYDENSTYKFELKGTLDHATANTQDNIDIDIPFTVIEIDDTIDSQIKVNVTDDVPTANSESALSVVEGNIALTGMVNLLDNDTKGADGLSSVTSFTYKDENGNTQNGTFGSTMNTKYGALVVNSDGTWTYTSDASENHTSSESLEDSFTYLITDADGDISTATQIINVTDGANPTINSTNNSLVKVYEGDSKATFNGTDNYDESSSNANKDTTSTVTHKIHFTKGTDDAGITSFTWEGVTANIDVGGSATITDNDTDVNTNDGKGILTVHYDGTWEYTAPADYTHPDADGVNYFQTTFTYTVTDTDGDAVTTGSQTIQVDDTLATLNSTTNVTLDEENLSTGTNPNANELTKSGDINIDVSKLNGTHDIKFSTQTDTTLLHNALSSSGDDISYAISTDGHTLTMYTGTDSTQNHVMVVTINNSTSTNPTYTAVLSQAFDHETALLENGNLEFDFNISLSDDDNDTGAQTFNVAIVDDAPVDTQTMTVDEDSTTNSANTINTNADATQTNTKITTNGKYGVGSIDENGKFHYEPNSNYSGEDTVKYTTTLDDGTTKETTVKVTVNPISDAPNITVDDSVIHVDEDNSITLGLNVPTITDSIDQNGIGSNNGDYSELLSAITISGIPSGIEVLKSDNSVLFTSDGTSKTIIIDDGGASIHINGTTAEYTLTKVEYEGLKVNPVAQSHENFTVTVSVDEQEVDQNGDVLAETSPETSSTSILVDVNAVTDVPTLTIDGGTTKNYTFDEDTVLDLSSDLAETFIDTDGSEDKSYKFEFVGGGDLPEGMKITVNGTTVTVSSNEISKEISYTGDNPTVTIQAPTHFSGDINNLKITLLTKDNDDDSDGTNGTNNVSTSYESDSVTINLDVSPISDNVTIEDKIVDEDNQITFLNDIALIDTDGSEEITSITINNLQNGWVLKDNDGSNPFTGNGTDDKTITLGDGTNGTYTLDEVKNFTLTPPAHSSKDEDISVTVNVKDTNPNDSSDTDTNTFKHKITITVNPIAERTINEDNSQADTDGNNISDIITQGDHTYTAKASEDNFFNLNTADSGFSLSLTNEDSVETTSVLFTPKDDSGNTLLGTVFKYGTTEYTYNGTAVEIPTSELANLQVKAPLNFSGTLKLHTQIKSIDYDDDTTDKEAADTQISDGDALTITVEPVADDVTVAIKQSIGKEDAGRKPDGTTDATSAANGIDLNVAITSDDKDGSETYTLDLKEIPNGAEIYYDGKLINKNSATVDVNIKATNDSGNSWSLQIKEFDNNADFKIVPPYNSNENINLKATANSVDGHDIGASSTTLDINVKVKGVADTPTHDTLKTQTISDTDENSKTYNKIVHEDSGEITLQTLFINDTANFSTADISVGDGSEKLYVLITNIPNGFDISGAKFLGGSDSSRQWLVEHDDFANVKMSVPSNYSGEVDIKLQLQSAENDGSKSNLKDIDLSILVTPETEGSVNKATTQNEDSSKILDFTFNNKGDSTEKLVALQINKETIPDGVKLVTASGVTLVKTNTGTAQWVSIVITNSSVEDITASFTKDSTYDTDTDYSFDFRYKTNDTTNDGSKFTDVESLGDDYDATNANWIKETYNVTVNPVTDDASSNITITTTDTSHITIDSNSKVTVSKTNTSFEVPITLTPDDMTSENSNGADDDGSEEITSIIITGVPEGVEVEGATYSGDILEEINGEAKIINSGEWILDAVSDKNLDSDGALNNLVFKVNGEKVNFNQKTTTGTIAIEINHKDGSSSILTNKEEFTFEVDSNYNGTGGTIKNDADSPMDLSLTTKTAQLIEDTSFKLSSLVEASDGTTNGDSSKFAILVSNLPDDYSLSGATIQSKTINGVKYYAILGKGDVADVNNLLAQVTVKPKTNENTLTKEKVDFDIKVLTYISEYEVNSDIVNGDFDAELAPVSDETTITVSANDTAESATVQEQTISLSLKNLADSGRVEIVGNKVKVTFTETITDKTASEQGVLKDSNGNILNFGVEHVFNINSVDDTLEFKYTPVSNRYGNLKIDSEITTKEKVNGETNQAGNTYTTEIKTTTNSKTIEITPVNTGITGNVAIQGNEDKIAYVTIDSTSLADDTETISSAKISGVPYGYDVYYDGVKQTGQLVGKDSNDEYLYEYSFNVNSINDLEKIGIKNTGVEHFSGKLEGIKFSVEVGESDLGHTQTWNLEANFEAVADDLHNLSPTKALGVEYVDSASTWTKINLNINVDDIDGSETISLEFDNLPTGVSFSLDGTTTYNASYDNSTDKYTISGISYDEINSLFIQTPAGYKGGNIEVKAWTVESSNNDTSDVETASFNINLESKASGVTSFTSEAIVAAKTIINSENYVSKDFEISLKVENLDLIDKDGSESLFVKISDLGNSFDVDVSNLTGVTATKVGTDWILDIGSATDTNLTKLANGDLKLVANDTDGSVDNINISAYSQLDDGSKSQEQTVSNIALNATVDNSGDIKATASNDNITTDLSIKIDGEAGYDKIILEPGTTIDFDKLDNIEELDLSKGDFTLTDIKLQDIVSMTDKNNELVIKCESGDEVKFKDETDKKWSKVAGTGADSGYDIYTNDGDNTVKVKVQTEISDGITS